MTGSREQIPIHSGGSQPSKLAGGAAVAERTAEQPLATLICCLTLMLRPPPGLETTGDVGALHSADWLPRIEQCGSSSFAEWRAWAAAGECRKGAACDGHGVSAPANPCMLQLGLSLTVRTNMQVRG
eukprot:1094106-Pelagomonas_calceolata.AAC.3